MISRRRAAAFTPCGATTSTISRSRRKPTYNTSLVEWFELRNGLLAAEAVATAALGRQESRGAHQRDDFPKADDRFLANQRLSLHDGELVSAFGRVHA